ncbi:hypothetical protein LG3211_0841 [Lysobacter gummosus]|nr:hypothetical protein LG3211_0841 [Lysobacter gummosus]
MARAPRRHYGEARCWRKLQPRQPHRYRTFGVSDAPRRHSI